MDELAHQLAHKDARIYEESKLKALAYQKVIGNDYSIEPSEFTN